MHVRGQSKSKAHGTIDASTVCHSCTASAPTGDDVFSWSFDESGESCTAGTSPWHYRCCLTPTSHSRRQILQGSPHTHTNLSEIHPVGLVQLGTYEEVEVGDQIVLSHQSRREPELAVGVAHAEHFPEHSSGDHVHLSFFFVVAECFTSKTSSCTGREGSDGGYSSSTAWVSMVCFLHHVTR